MFFVLMFALFGCTAKTNVSGTKDPLVAPPVQIQQTNESKEEKLVWRTLTREILQEALNNSKIVIVQVGVPKNELCEMMKEITYKNQQVIHLLNEHYIVIDEDGSDYPEDAFEGFPTTVFLLPDGDELGRFSGVVLPEKFVKLLQGIDRRAKGTLWQ